MTPEQVKKAHDEDKYAVVIYCPYCGASNYRGKLDYKTETYTCIYCKGVIAKERLLDKAFKLGIK